MILTRHEIQQFLNSHDYDIRKSHNGRWIDQKCTPDVLAVVSDCIVMFDRNILHGNATKTFTSVDIWHSEYTSKYALSTFNKTDVHEKTAQSEYDKFFAQPMKLLANAEILREYKQGKQNIYRIARYDILNYIALRDANAFTFLYDYIEKVLTDSSIITQFNIFFGNQNVETFNILKEFFVDFIISNTKINRPLEPKRIFTKVLNILSCQKQAHGTQKGRYSKGIINYDQICYNRTNFRDEYSNKPKNITRQEHLKNIPIIDSNISEYHIQKSKRYAKEFNAQLGINSELLFELNTCNKAELRKINKIPALHAHHIFMKSEFPSISNDIENLILLTPDEHYFKAHPKKTYIVDTNYQYLFLLSKLAIIDIFDQTFGDSSIYSLENFKNVINVGKNAHLKHENYSQMYIEIQRLYKHNSNVECNIEYIDLINSVK